MLTTDTAISAFRSAGVRVTPQRMMVVEALVDNRTHPTVESIYDHVRSSYPSFSLATVYHTINLLVRHGLVLELRGAKDRIHCDPETAPHAHGYCEQCGRVYDLPIPALPSWSEENLAGFLPSRVEVTAYGSCASCRGNG